MFQYVLLLISAVVIAHCQTRQFDLRPTGEWTDTGIDVQPGDSLKFAATGQVQYSNARQPSDPDGLNRGWADLIRQLPVNEAGRGAVVGRIGSSAAARAFLIGSQGQFRAPISGRLFLAVNQGSGDSASGAYKVRVERTAAPSDPNPPATYRLPAFSQDLLDSVARRVNDAEGTPGDRVNFFIVGSEQKLQTAFGNAGWVTVDRSSKDALIQGALATLSKKAYVTLPMSELVLFGRPQDYGYAQGDPLRVIASRHHFRLWKAPFQLDGQTVWAGAGTHDIGFDRDQRNGRLTHKIDPDVDQEREYIRESLSQTGLVVKTEYMTPSDPVTRARTAHGEEFSSDGRTLIVYLKPDATTTTGAQTPFADLFCTVLKLNAAGGNWGPCGRYVEGGGREDVQLAALPTKFRVVIVPGILSSCVSDSPAFQEGQEVLKKQGLDVNLIQVPNDSSESNARMIAKRLGELANGDPRKFIVVGYSKGTPDLQVALATEDGVKDLVAAFISVAGASGGSPIADVLPPQADRYLGTVPMQNCKGDLATGFKSLKRDARRAFLTANPQSPVPAYSIVAKSDKTTTSKALMQTWQVLSTYNTVQDGQLLKDDAVVPGSVLLGYALADHFAVALPFDKSPDATIRAGMDKTVYPRAALLEAAVRYVVADLAGR